MPYIKKTCVSIVSHGQWGLILPLLRDLEKYSEFISIIILTLNLPESIDTKEFKNNILVIKNTFQLIDGFDERFFMYLEDVDICKRLINNNYKIFIDNENRVIHNAQRESRKNIKLFFIHLNSLLKYFVKWGLFK